MRTNTMQSALFNEQDKQSPVQVIGVGDAGCRAASEIWRRKIRGVDVTCIDTDALSLDRSQSDHTVLLGAATMHGFGSGGDIDAVASAALDRSFEIADLASGATCVAMIAGMTGGTGPGAAPVIADAIRSSGTLVIGVPIAPLEFEPVCTHLAAADAQDRLISACDGIYEIGKRGRSGPAGSLGPSGIALHDLFTSDRNEIATFVSAIATVANSETDRCDANSGDLMSIIHNGCLMVFGTGTGIGHKGAAEATQKCLDEAFSDSAREIDRALVLVESGPDIPVSHIATVTSLVESRIGANTELHTAVRRSRLLGSNVRVSILGGQREPVRRSLADPYSLPRKLLVAATGVGGAELQRSAGHLLNPIRAVAPRR